MYYSDSSFYEPTYSEDERIDAALEREKQHRKEVAEDEERSRKAFFEKLHAEEDQPLFSLPGLNFVTFRHDKIKFTFVPSEMSKLVSKKVKFTVSLRYSGQFWTMKRNNLPVNYKWQVYKLFYAGDFFAIDDDSVLDLLMKIYNIMVRWTTKEQNFRLDKFKRYRDGDSDVELDTDDEEIFLSSEERQQLHQNRVRILKRMLPPRNKRTLPPKKKRRAITTSSEDSVELVL